MREPILRLLDRYESGEPTPAPPPQDVHEMAEYLGADPPPAMAEGDPTATELS